MKRPAGAAARERALARWVLGDLALFSRHVLGRPLRPYQLEPARAILGAVLGRQGGTFAVAMSRQAGKNETSAQLEAYLLNLYQRRGGQIVKASPTFKPQTFNSLLRLKERLDNPWNRRRWQPESGYMLRMGLARAVFFSAEPSARVMGATASILLEGDEAQDITPDKWNRDFRPMAAATNAVTVLWGTIWTRDTLLARTMEALGEQERRDGVRRVFRYAWDEVAAHNPAYGAYVEGEIARLGRQHPLIRTQYCLEEIDGEGGFLDAARRAQLRGDFPRQEGPRAGAAYVAGVDVAGEDEAVADIFAPTRAPRRDSTVETVAEVERREVAGVPLPHLRVVRHYRWTGRAHTEQLGRLVDLLKRVWGVRRAAVDATGVGAGLAGFLAAALGAGVVEQFQFSAQSKSRLGYALLGAANTGRVKVYQDDGSDEAREFWLQCEQCRYAVRENQTLSFYVPESAGHDDFLSSLALCLAAAESLGSAPAPALGVLRPTEV